MTHHPTRREFMGLSALGIAGIVARPVIGDAATVAAEVAPSTRGAEPDLVVTNASVYTMDAAMPRAEAFAVKNGRFVAVGNSAAMKALAGKGTQLYDAKRMTIVPGFIDTHNHAFGNVLLYEVIVGNPFEVEFVTIASIIDKLRARAQQTPAGTWVEGWFFDDTKVKDKRALNVHDLDKVSTEHPVVVRHRGGHTSFYNSKALDLAGVNRNTPNRPGGTYDRDTNGDLNGRVTDLARDVFDKVGGRPVFTTEQVAQRERDGLAHISKEFARYGLTSVHHEGGDLAALQDVRARGDLKHRVSYEASGRVLESMIAGGIKTGFGDEWI
ncbi:MAG: amidohydrolase family protein, partial [bacterium]